MATCSFCSEKAVSSYLVREGVIPRGYDEDAKKNPDRSHLRIVRVCLNHKKNVAK